ncbi:MAG: POTRA domain-containing protein, partial [Planctomycetota bacterium]
MIFFKATTVSFIIAAIILMLPADAFAQQANEEYLGRIVSSVEVQVEKGDYTDTDEKTFQERVRNIRTTVFANIKSDANKPFSAPVLNEDVRRLTAIGQFHVDVRLSETEDGVKIIFVILPKFRIKKIKLQLENGGSPSGIEELQKSITSSIGEYFSKYFAEYDAETLASKYNAKGYPFARAWFKYKVSEKGFVELTFFIDPGPYMKIGKVVFKGNKFFSSDKLYSLMETRRYTFLRNIFGDPTYNIKRIETDIQKIRETYRNNGFLDVKIFLKDVVLDLRRNLAMPVIEIEEGSRYLVSSVKLSGVKKFEESKIT